ncbi:WD repeat protein 61 [Rhodotorula toruloides]|uniref:BY PROTMAP: gi/472586084/gb/EMS23626.1/ WD repeat protein 61 [Rhodosporidium toruloides NP11] gi/647395512/emb/CDR36976.1/ RHTO0S02e09340g1_1 [Rhodosporidium toruloides] n=1 Tax=Rhodotorula toruloides TaxID=5286 RepID=A0A0K3C632_RHOTO|nr:WD repeat protein 61 [Rhodotorula toruloides]
MSATYILSAVSEPSPSSSTLPPRTTSPPSTPGGEQGHSDAIWCAKWGRAAGGGEVVVTAGADHSVKIWTPAQTSAPTRTIRPPKSLGIVGLDVDKAETGASFLVASSLDSVITRWSIEGESEGRVELGPAASWDVSLHPGAPQFATAGGEGKVKVMSSAKETFGQELAALEATGKFGMAVEYSQGGNLLAVSSDTGYVTLFDAETGSLVSSFPAHSAPIRSLSFTSNLLITGSDDKRINVFDLRALTSHSGAAGGGGRRGQVASMGGHEGWVVTVAARNERLLASGSSDGTIKLFDLSSPSTALSTLRDHTGDVWSLAWAPEQAGSAPAVEGLGGAAAGLGGGRFVSAGEDGRLRWWNGGG